jgi:hypothetical protein
MDGLFVGNIETGSYSSSITAESFFDQLIDLLLVKVGFYDKFSSYLISTF